MGAIFLNDHISEDGSQDLEKLFLGSKTDKRFLKRSVCILKEQRKRKFLKKISKKIYGRGMSGIKSSPPEGNIKPSWLMDILRILKFYRYMLSTGICL